MSQHQPLDGPSLQVNLLPKGNGANERQPHKAVFYIHSALGAAKPRMLLGFPWDLGQSDICHNYAKTFFYTFTIVVALLLPCSCMVAGS